MTLLAMIECATLGTEEGYRAPQAPKPLDDTDGPIPVKAETAAMCATLNGVYKCSDAVRRKRWRSSNERKRLRERDRRRREHNSSLRNSVPVG